MGNDGGGHLVALTHDMFGWPGAWFQRWLMAADWCRPVHTTQLTGARTMRDQSESVMTHMWSGI